MEWQQTDSLAIDIRNVDYVDSCPGPFIGVSVGDSIGEQFSSMHFSNSSLLSIELVRNCHLSNGIHYHHILSLSTEMQIRVTQ